MLVTALRRRGHCEVRSYLGLQQHQHVPGKREYRMDETETDWNFIDNDVIEPLASRPARVSLPLSVMFICA